MRKRSLTDYVIFEFANCFLPAIQSSLLNREIPRSYEGLAFVSIWQKECLIKWGLVKDT